MLSGRVILVTGGHGRLGPTLVEAIESRGGTPVFTSRDTQRAEAFNREAQSAGRRARARVYSFREEGEASVLIESLLSDFGAVHGLVNNAYADVDYRPVEQPAWDAWLDSARVGLAAASELAGVLVDLRERTRVESVVNIASIYALAAPDFAMYPEGKDPPAAWYGAIKAAQIQLTGYLAARWGRYGVRVNAVSPGGIHHAQDEDFLARYGATVPMGRMVTAAEVANAVCFLLGPESSGITGDNLLVDGGRSAW